MSSKSFLDVKYTLLNDDASPPRQVHDTDSGLDIAIYGIKEKISDTISHYHSGLVFEPPEGFYFEMYARSSLHKRGYQLATGVSVIDSEYRGEVVIPLEKISPDADDLFKDEDKPYVVQLILKKKYPVKMILSFRNELTQTDRGKGGFGSTDQDGQS